MKRLKLKLYWKRHINDLGYFFGKEPNEEYSETGVFKYTKVIGNFYKREFYADAETYSENLKNINWLEENSK